MKTALLLASMTPMTCLFSMCRFSFGADDSWKEQFGNPALLLENASTRYVYLYDQRNEENMIQDEDLTFSNAIKEAGPFVEISKKDPTSERYFTYEALIQSATSGPNFCRLYTYEDGLLIIHHKTSLGPNQYAYFSMDLEKAKTLNDLVFNTIEKQ